MTETLVAGEDQHQRVLDQLAKHVDTISGGASRHEPVHFISDTWRRWLEGTEVVHSSSAVLNELHNGSVDRSQINEFAHRANDADGRMRLLLATLIWGRGKSNGRMRPHIVKAVTHPDCDKVLVETQRLTRDGDLPGAFRGWTLPGLRAPFFTKWLWASTLTLPPGDRALILDARVWKTLGVLGWDSCVATGGDRRRAQRYEVYVESARRWAQELTTPTNAVIPDDIEWAMFSANGDLGRLRGRA